MRTIEIKNEHPVWVVWTNTDLTEGRGTEYPLYLCDIETTAIRLGRKKYVMGTDSRVTKSVCFFSQEHRSWFGPVGVIVPPSEEDIREVEKLNVERARQLVIEKFEKGEDISPEERQEILKILKK